MHSAPSSFPRLRLLVLAVCCAYQAQAGAQAQPADAVDTVLVTGQRASIRKAILMQEGADNIVSAVSADDIGALPDMNASEAAARLPGISVQRDQGEGRYVTVRGLGPDLNAVTINGALVPAPENGRRGVSLDVLPTGMVRSLEVTKTLTPDMDANSLGGTVDVKTISAFDSKTPVLNVNLADGYNTLAKAHSPQGGVLWADRFMQGTVGVAIGASMDRRKLASDDVETGGAWSSGRLGTVEFRDYQPVRENKAAALNLDWRPGLEGQYYLRTFHSSFSDDEVRDRLTISNITGGSAAQSSIFTARAERRLRQRKYTRTIDSTVLGGERQFGDWKLSANAAASEADEDQPNALNDVQFRQNGVTGLSFSGTELPVLSGTSNLYDASRYNLNAITFQSRASRDREKHAQFDLARRINLGEAESTLKFGAKTSRRNKANDTDQWAFTSASASSPNYWGAGPTTLAGFTGPAGVDFPQQIGLAIDPDLVRARVAGLDAAAARSLAASVTSDWAMHENIRSWYVQDATTFGDWHMLVGMRSERTSFNAQGNQVSSTNAVTPVQRAQSYTHFLPNFQLRYNVDANTSLRAAITRAVVRANFSQLAPGIAYASPTEATIGNPDLKPLRSNNYDLGIERVFGAEGTLSLYAFKKDIKDFTYQTNLAGTGAWKDFTTATGFVNGEAASVKGVELNYNQALHFLPGPWSGLIVGANATFTDSDSSLSRFDKTAGALRSRTVALPGQSDRIMNLMVGYEAGSLSTRLAANMKSRYLLQTGADVLDESQDNWVDNQTQYDFSLRYQVAKRWKLGFDVLNITREKYYVYLGSRAYNVQNEQYGRTFRLSLQGSLL
jgi:TonB-dependent receptor